MRYIRAGRSVPEGAPGSGADEGRRWLSAAATQTFLRDEITTKQDGSMVVLEKIPEVVLDRALEVAVA